MSRFQPRTLSLRLTLAQRQVLRLVVVRIGEWFGIKDVVQIRMPQTELRVGEDGS